MKEYIVTTEQGANQQFHELIRCKYCKHWDGYYCHEKWWGNGYGNYYPPIKNEDGFCDWADRREDD